MDKREVREVLERPFPKDLHRTRKGSFGKELRYVEVSHYVRRLNEAFAGDWHFDIIEHHILESEVVVVGRLTAGGIVKTAFGGSSITTARETGKAVSIADDLKAAASDALKKACSLLGIGLELYSDCEDAADGDVPAVSAGPGGNPASSRAGIPEARGNGNGQTLTQRQYKAILALAREAGLSEPDFRTRVLRKCGVPLEKLTRTQASQLISSQMHGDGRKAAGGGG